MDRRTFLTAFSSALAASSLPWPVLAASTAQRPGLIAAWRTSARFERVGGAMESTGTGAPTDYVGVLEPDWQAGRVVIRHAVAVPNRVHGLVATPDGGFIAVAYRPGRWLLRMDAGGAPVTRLDLADEQTGRTFNGHGVLTPDGGWLITTETDPKDSAGWISVRDTRTLRKVAEWPSHGIEPHQACFDGNGHLVVANGGILRGASDRKRDLDQMDSSLVRLDMANGRQLGQWRLDDPRLSLRHLACAHGQPAAGGSMIGVAMQAEHDDPVRRAAAPVLAVLDGDRFAIPSHVPLARGYCGDIVAAPGGGFHLSGERSDRAYWWHPGQPAELTTIAELGRAGALAASPADGTGDVFIAAARGMARWHRTQPPKALPWPVELAPDNHWVFVAGG